MRIGLLIYGSLDTLTGGYFYDRQIVEAWRAAGDTVEIVSLPWRGYWRHLGDNLSGSFASQLRALPVDVLIQDQLCHPSVLWLNRRLEGKLPYPQLSLIHLLKQSEVHPAGLAELYRWLENDYLQHVDGFIYNSNDSQTLVEARLQKPRPGIIAYPGRDHLPGRQVEPEIAKDEIRIVSIGNIVKRKGQHLLIQALARQSDLPWHLTLIGSGEFEPTYAQQVQQLIAESGLNERITFLGRVPNDELASILSEQHLFVLPSSYEGFGIVYLEAHLAALPVIATTAGAAHEIVVDGETGYLVPPDDVESLSNCLRRTMMDRNQLWQMGQAAQARALKFPTWVETANNIRTFAQDCIEAFRD